MKFVLKNSYSSEHTRRWSMWMTSDFTFLFKLLLSPSGWSICRFAFHLIKLTSVTLPLLAVCENVKRRRSFEVELNNDISVVAAQSRIDRKMSLKKQKKSSNTKSYAKNENCLKCDRCFSRKKNRAAELKVEKFLAIIVTLSRVEIAAHLTVRRFDVTSRKLFICHLILYLIMLTTPNWIELVVVCL